MWLLITFNYNMIPVSRKKREWTELDGTAVSRRSVAQVRVNSGDPGPCPKIRLKEPGPNGTSAGFQTDENRYYTLILAGKVEKRFRCRRLTTVDIDDALTHAIHKATEVIAR